MTATAPVEPKPQVWLSSKQAAARAGRHERTIRDACHEYVRTRGKSGLRAYQPGVACSWRIHVDDLDVWVMCEPPKRRRLVRAS